jgi:Ca2+-transporting ATPase
VPAAPLLLLPVHLAFLELVIDPTCSLVFEAEPEAPDVMERPPRPRDGPLLSARSVVIALAQGLGVLASCAAVMLLARGGHPPEGIRALTFTTLVVGVVALSFASRAHRSGPNRVLWAVAGSALALLAVVLAVPAVRELFRFAPVPLADVALAAGAGLASLGWTLVAPRARGRAAGLAAGART